ncbi:MAG: hypothetical protein CVU09_16605 [Bacteroidetes bacterium HGW-Bacteroidetes-4]|jgi:hypothetical protein|nr:MAG: hypothetical protein CVU09_16605 [Bacteroidetes bacterium HGW-Bacteroidetes-4]
MKLKIKLGMFVLASLFFMVACSSSDETENYWYSYGTYLDSDLSDEGFIMKMDNGDTLIPVSVDYIQEGIVDGSRVIPIYSIVTEEGNLINVKVSKIEAILTKPIIQLTEEIADSIGNDPVTVWDGNVWFSENHLNVIFSYLGSNKVHSINLVKPIGEQLDDEGRQILEFRHNDNGDFNNIQYTGIVSFDMSSLYQDGMDTLAVLFKSHDYYAEDFTWEGTFVFNPDDFSGKAAEPGEPIQFVKSIK